MMGTTVGFGNNMGRNGGDSPVSRVSWDQAQSFCGSLTEQERTAGRLPARWEYRLPTEAQWEYACRAGSETLFTFGDDESGLGEYAWFKGNASGVNQHYAHQVGLKQANGWGLYDICGNVQEWCRDWYNTKLPGGLDPEVTTGSKAERVARGGCFRYEAGYCRSETRMSFTPAYRDDDVGFRVAAVRSGQ
jgi:sulfatase modifying factor 1